MMIIGCDYHVGFEQIAWVDTETGELHERRLEHREEAEKFYRELAVQGASVRLGMEASGPTRWFERLAMRQGRKITKVAVARTLAVRAYWMWRQGWDYEQLEKVQFSRGTARKSPRCAAEHRVIDWVSRSPSHGSSK
jgi:hypothetical protein